jgi:hypothetical protein
LFEKVTRVHRSHRQARGPYLSVRGPTKNSNLYGNVTMNPSVQLCEKLMQVDIFGIEGIETKYFKTTCMVCLFLIDFCSLLIIAMNHVYLTVIANRYGQATSALYSIFDIKIS